MALRQPGFLRPQIDAWSTNSVKSNRLPAIAALSGSTGLPTASIPLGNFPALKGATVANQALILDGLLFYASNRLDAKLGAR